ncbi:AMP-binding protein [Streptomyces sp. NPDC058755]|uniref:AMP-binding protein n=1 Tax=Streptomyces sp. NPDC058755 TaxID=3346624 RepID=UPI0036B0AB75
MSSSDGPPGSPGCAATPPACRGTCPRPRGRAARPLDAAAHRYGGCTALSAQGSRTGFRALRRTVARVARALARLGLRCGNHVALPLPDCPEAAVPCHAVWRLGAVVVPGDITDRRRALTHAAVAAVPKEPASEIAACGDRALLRAVATVEATPARRGGAARTRARKDAESRAADPARGEQPPGPDRTGPPRRPGSVICSGPAWSAPAPTAPH